MRIILSSILVVGLFGVSAVSSAQESTVNLTEKLSIRHEISLLNKKIGVYLNDRDVKIRLRDWLGHEKNEKYVESCQEGLKTVLPSPNILGPLCYLLRQRDGRKQQAFDLLKRYFWEIKLAFQEISEDPQYDERYQEAAGAIAAKISIAREVSAAQTCLTSIAPLRDNYSSSFNEAGACLKQRLSAVDNDGVKSPFTSFPIAEVFYPHPGYTISETGWISGNKVQYLTENNRTEELTMTLAAKSTLIATKYPLTGAGSFKAMKARISKMEAGDSQSGIFTEEEGFWTFAQHPVWSQSTGIFSEIREAINSASKTIFIDIFFLGGTMGASLAKQLVFLAETKNIKVFVLHDVNNPFADSTKMEMQPVFNYLKAYSMLHPDRLMAIDSYIAKHRSGLPDYVQSLFPEKFFASTKLDKKLPLNPRAVSDHSKVIVIDGKTSTPKAFVGSKNLTDASGAVCFDEVVKVEGPVAAVVQDDYYLDMFNGIANDPVITNNKRDAEYYDISLENGKALVHFGTNGWSKSRATEKANIIADILEPFDLLERNKSGVPLRAVEVLSKGSILVRTGFNNWDSSKTNVVDQNVQAILMAKRQILIKDQFLFDRNIVLALLQAKEANPNLDIQAIIEPLHSANPRGLPNILYADILSKAKIEIKFAQVSLASEAVRQEYHMKTISVDGQQVIAGSANKDQTTMYGSFREEQLQVFDPEAARRHDEAFERDWKRAEPFVGFSFDVPGNLKGLNGQPMGAKQFIELLRDFVSVLYDARGI